MGKKMNKNINNSIENNMNIHTKDILKYLKDNRVVTSSELANHLKISWNTSDKWLLELAFQGKVDRIKKKGVNLWVLK